jgi:hypothetical protein
VVALLASGVPSPTSSSGVTVEDPFLGWVVNGEEGGLDIDGERERVMSAVSDSTDGLGGIVGELGRVGFAVSDSRPV